MAKHGEQAQFSPGDIASAGAGGYRDAEAFAAASRLEWSPTLGDGRRMSYAAAEAACAALGEGWRLPSIQELLSLVDYSRHDPAIDIALYPDTKSGAYWTSTPVSWAPSAAWIVDFGGGGSNGYYRFNDVAFVRACRALPAGQ